MERRPSADEVLKTIKEKGIRFVDLQFTDIRGRLQHTTVSSRLINADILENGIPKLDGSSINGFALIQESDLVLKPDPSTFAVLPWFEESCRFLCDVYWGKGKGRLGKDPRGVAQRAEEYAKELGYETFWGPEVEFFVFDEVSWDVSQPYRGMWFEVASKEEAWGSNGYPIRFKEGYYPAPPQDTLMGFRSEVAKILEDDFGIPCIAHHHEVATAGQCEIDMEFGHLTRMADNVMTYKYVVKNLARQKGLIATFMPKPVYMDSASGMHVNVSLWRDGENVFYDENDEYAEISDTARYFIGGLMEHSSSLMAVSAPTTNSYKRLVPGYEAPVYVTWSVANRSAGIRVPAYHRGRNFAASKRIEFRPPDPSANPYLCFSAILMAGLDGIKKKLDPGDPFDGNVYSLTEEEKREMGIRELPGSLKEAVESLLSDNEYLKPVFDKELIDTIAELELKDYGKVESMPHPYEFYLYFDL